MESQVGSCLYPAWREISYQASNENIEMPLAVPSRTKYVQYEVPQQDNGSDRGLQEQAVESMDIADLNYQLQTCDVMNTAIPGGCIDNRQNYGSTMSVAEDIHPVYLVTTEVFLESLQQPKRSVRRRSAPPTSPMSPPRTGVSGARALPSEQVNHKNKKWTDKETSELLVALVWGRTRRGKRGGMRWDDVHIEDAEGRRRTKDQCQNRYDVLSKAYKTMKEYAIETGKPFSEITAEERRNLKLATPLREDWYMELDEFHCHRRRDNAKSPKACQTQSWS